MKILACSDIHMGRVPSVGNDTLVNGHSSWDAIVAKAIALQVDVVALVGDVVEQEDAWLSVYYPLLAGLERLKRAGIKVIAVGGNHDWEIFPRLAKQSDAITLLGLGGSWEACQVEQVRFVGWSFPHSHVKENPFLGFKQDLLANSPLTLGLLHTEIDVPSSRYAPVSQSDLASRQGMLWMLGHIHKPGKIKDLPAYYCGSPYALDVNEDAVHGVYLLQNDGNTAWKEPVFIPLCPYRFERCSIEVTGSIDQLDLQMRATQTIRRFAAELNWEGKLYLRLVYTGYLATHLDLAKIFPFQEETIEFFSREEETDILLFTHWEDRTQLEVDLAQLAQGSGPDALLARMLLDPEQLAELAKQYKLLDAQSFNSSAFSLLPHALLSSHDALESARNAGMLVLRSLVMQKSGGAT
ncbi:metallophosphoesterase family protein [Sphaerochaeta sp.]|uniref:metallophosphoesterase family protein n=1 Tax=Sphaerochaeta sp. TaxID=1972642 RepID=UPI002FCC3FB0